MRQRNAKTIREKLSINKEKAPSMMNRNLSRAIDKDWSFLKRSFIPFIPYNALARGAKSRQDVVEKLRFAILYL